jgi:hypothetical protein
MFFPAVTPERRSDGSDSLGTNHRASIFVVCGQLFALLPFSRTYILASLSPTFTLVLRGSQRAPQSCRDRQNLEFRSCGWLVEVSSSATRHSGESRHGRDQSKRAFTIPYCLDSIRTNIYFDVSHAVLLCHLIFEQTHSPGLINAILFFSSNTCTTNYRYNGFSTMACPPW